MSEPMVDSRDSNFLEPLVNARRFFGRGAIVTGGSKGIGAGIVRRLVIEGAWVVVADIDGTADEILQKLPASLHSNVIVRKVDISKESEIQEFVQWLKQRGSSVDVLVNNAARFVFAAAEDVTGEELDQAFAVNVRGTALMTKHVVPLMKGTPDSIHRATCSRKAVVNISSISSSIAQPGFVPYSMTKGAIAQLTRNQALDLAKHGIRVNAVNPGPVLTDGTRRQAASEGRTLDQMCAELSSNLVVGRMGMPEDVAAAVAFLASDDASFITGTALVVDGGYTLQ